MNKNLFYNQSSLFNKRTIQEIENYIEGYKKNQNRNEITFYYLCTNYETSILVIEIKELLVQLKKYRALLDDLYLKAKDENNIKNSVKKYKMALKEISRNTISWGNLKYLYGILMRILGINPN